MVAKRMAADEEREARLACESLVIRYALYIDECDPDRLAALFDEHGEIVTPSVHLRGAAEIRSAIAARSPSLRTRHVMTNILVEIETPRSAAASSYLTLYRRTESGPEEAPLVSGPTLVGIYHDRFILIPDGWRFASRELKVSFQGWKDSSRE